MEAFLVSIASVAVAEMGDRTQLLALVLAARFRKPWPIRRRHRIGHACQSRRGRARGRLDRAAADAHGSRCSGGRQHAGDGAMDTGARQAR